MNSTTHTTSTTAANLHRPTVDKYGQAAARALVALIDTGATSTDTGAAYRTLRGVEDLRNAAAAISRNGTTRGRRDRLRAALTAILHAVDAATVDHWARPGRGGTGDVDPVHPHVMEDGATGRGTGWTFVNAPGVTSLRFTTVQAEALVLHLSGLTRYVPALRVLDRDDWAGA